ncbi:unnamed protein product, partial [Didymodactylos carnosus]
SLFNKLSQNYNEIFRSLCVGEKPLLGELDDNNYLKAAIITKDFELLIFIQFKQEQTFDFVHGLFVNILDTDAKIFIKNSSSRRNSLKLISQHDPNPKRFNVELDELSFGSQLIHQIVLKYPTIEPFPTDDLFVNNHPNQRRCIEQFWLDHQQRLRDDIAKQRRTYLPNDECRFTRIFSRWLNRTKPPPYTDGEIKLLLTSSITENETVLQFNRAEGSILNGIFIHGKSQTGKTELIDYYLKDQTVLRPALGEQFNFDRLDDRVNYILIDNFDSGKYSTLADHLKELIS